MYTTSVDVHVGSAVLQLLAHLVQCRVNYSLLDTQHRFLKHLYTQIEQIHEQQHLMLVVVVVLYANVLWCCCLVLCCMLLLYLCVVVVHMFSPAIVVI